MSLIERALDEQARDARQRADEFVEDVLADQAEEIERTDEFPTDVIEAAGEYGLTGVMLPEEYGGLGLAFEDLSVGGE
jgi:alkylation response protein AidB-like acyl-CoA dehydrogenase